MKNGNNFLKRNLKIIDKEKIDKKHKKYSDFGKIFLKTLDKREQWVYNDTDKEKNEVTYGYCKKAKG